VHLNFYNKGVNMSEIKLFRYGQGVQELKSSSAVLEKEIQKVIENNMLEFFGVNFLQSEWSVNNGQRRIDSIGIDENNCPVIFEYKCHSNENVINQGLYYLNWLLEHKADYKLLVIEKMGNKLATNIDWSMPRIICIAGDFNKYDEEAINLINRNISLIRYTKFEKDLLMFELLNTNKVDPIIEEGTKNKGNSQYNLTTFKEQYDKAPESIKEIFDEIKDFALTLGDDVSDNILKLYLALKKIKNFATMGIYQTKIIINFRLNPADYELNEKLRDVSEIGHWGCGNLELTIKSKVEIDLAKNLLKQAYENN